MTVPADSLSLAQEHLRLMVADSTAFRAWAAAASQAAALARIHHDVLPAGAGTEHTLAELQAARPFAIVWTDPEGGYEFSLASFDDGFSYRDAGRIWLLLEQDVPAADADDPAELHIKLRNLMGALIKDLCGMAGKAGYLNLTKGIVFGPTRGDDEDIPGQGDYMQMALRVDWMG
jgi:hypothetical protein